MLYPRFSENEYQRRESLAKSLMKEKNLDALLVYASGEGGPVSYLSGYLGARPSYLIYPLDGEPCLIVYFYNHIPCATEMSIVKDIQWDRNDSVGCVVENITKRKLSSSSFGIVGLNSIPYVDYIGITSKLPGCKFTNVGREFNMIRTVRSEEELDWFRKSAYLTDLTVEALEKKIRPGLTEHDLVAIIQNSFLADDGQVGPTTFLASTDMSNPDVFVPWQYASSRVLRRGYVVITEITASYYGYRAQIHRPFAVGVEPTQLYRELFDVALECFERVSRALKPDATSKDVIEASSVIEERGFTAYDSLLHGEGGKNPELGTKSSAHPFEPFTFKENMVMVIQPQPITKDHKAGLQLGAACIVTPSGGKSLHNYPFKFPVCGAD
jgi:Xaa-Pro dipeptidase